MNHSGWKERFILPADADTLMTAANYRNGELQLQIPKGKPGIAKEIIEVFVY